MHKWWLSGLCSCAATHQEVKSPVLCSVSPALDMLPGNKLLSTLSSISTDGINCLLTKCLILAPVRFCLANNFISILLLFCAPDPFLTVYFDLIFFLWMKCFFLLLFWFPYSVWVLLIPDGTPQIVRIVKVSTQYTSQMASIVVYNYLSECMLCCMVAHVNKSLRCAQ